MPDEPLSEAELEELAALAQAASPAPWVAHTGPGHREYIAISDRDGEQPDMYVEHDEIPAPAADLQFIAAARNSVPRLIAEIRRLRGG